MARMLDEHYSAERYVKLLKLVEQIDSAKRLGYYDKLRIFRELGVKQVQRGRAHINVYDLRLSVLEKEFSQLVGEMKSYLNKHKAEFDEQVRSGELRNAGLGWQLELAFTHFDKPSVCPDTRANQTTREDAYHFMRSRNASYSKNS